MSKPDFPEYRFNWQLVLIVLASSLITITVVYYCYDALTHLNWDNT